MTTPKPPSQPGCEWIEECIEECTATAIYIEEQGVAATFLNPRRKKIRKIHYDGCYNKTPGVYKADYILSLPGVVDVVLELKGSHTNLKHALVQVVSTLEVWRTDLNCSAKPAALIVYGAIRARDNLPRRRPSANSSVQTVGSDFRKIFKGRVRLLIHESGERQFTFNDFLRKNDVS